MATLDDLLNLKININILKDFNEIGKIKKNNTNDKECAICLKKIALNKNHKVLDKCNHSFHIKCINEWLENNNNCPICRIKY